MTLHIRLLKIAEAIGTELTGSPLFFSRDSIMKIEAMYPDARLEFLQAKLKMPLDGMVFFSYV